MLISAFSFAAGVFFWTGTKLFDNVSSFAVYRRRPGAGILGAAVCFVLAVWMGRRDNGKNKGGEAPGQGI
jgi:hypothetical protein